MSQVISLGPSIFRYSLVRAAIEDNDRLLLFEIDEPDGEIDN